MTETLGGKKGVGRGGPRQDGKMAGLLTQAGLPLGRDSSTYFSPEGPNSLLLTKVS